MCFFLLSGPVVVLLLSFLTNSPAQFNFDRVQYYVFAYYGETINNWSSGCDECILKNYNSGCGCKSSEEKRTRAFIESDRFRDRVAEKYEIHLYTSSYILLYTYMYIYIFIILLLLLLSWRSYNTTRRWVLQSGNFSSLVLRSTYTLIVDFILLLLS